MIEIRLPKPGPEFHDATITRWDCREGDRIERGDTLAIIKTSFGSLRVTAEEEGVMEAILQKRGETIDFEQPIAILGRAQPISRNETSVEHEAEPALPSPKRTTPQPPLKPNSKSPEPSPTKAASSRSSLRVPEEPAPVAQEITPAAREEPVLPTEAVEEMYEVVEPAIPESVHEFIEPAHEPVSQSLEEATDEPAEILELMLDDGDLPASSVQEEPVEAVDDEDPEQIPEVAQSEDLSTVFEEEAPEEETPLTEEEVIPTRTEEAIAFEETDAASPIEESTETSIATEIDAIPFTLEEPQSGLPLESEPLAEASEIEADSLEITPDSIPQTPEVASVPIAAAEQGEEPSVEDNPLAEVEEMPIPPPPPAPAIRVEVSPAALKLALRHGIDIDSVQGTGDKGKILYLDVERALQSIEESARNKRLEEEEAAAAHPLTLPQTSEEVSSENEECGQELTPILEHEEIEKSDPHGGQSTDQNSESLEGSPEEASQEKSEALLPEQKFTLQETGLEPSFNNTHEEPNQVAIETASEIPLEPETPVADPLAEVEVASEPELQEVVEEPTESSGEFIALDSESEMDAAQEPLSEPVLEPELDAAMASDSQFPAEVEPELEPVSDSEQALVNPVDSETSISEENTPAQEDAAEPIGEGLPEETEDLVAHKESPPVPVVPNGFPSFLGAVAFHIFDEEDPDPLSAEVATQDEPEIALAEANSDPEEADTSMPIPDPVVSEESMPQPPIAPSEPETSNQETPRQTHQPHPLYLSTELDFTLPAAWLQDYNERNHQSISLSDLMLKACGNALASIPSVNAAFRGDEIIRNEEIAVELSLPVDARTVTLTITDIDQKSLLELHSELLQYTGPEAIEPEKPSFRANFVLSMLNMFGINRVFPSILYPQTCALGVGAVRKQVMPVDAFIGIRQVMELNLACNPLAMDGIQGARFIQQIQTDLELLKPREYPEWLKGGQPFRIMENRQPGTSAEEAAP